MAEKNVWEADSIPKTTVGGKLYWNLVCHTITNYFTTAGSYTGWVESQKMDWFNWKKGIPENCHCKWVTRIQNHWITNHGYRR